MKKIPVDGKECMFFVERAGDGGAIVNTLVPEDDGTYSNYRHWFSDPVVARQMFDGIDANEAARRAATARAPGISGRRHGTAIDPGGARR